MRPTPLAASIGLAVAFASFARAQTVPTGFVVDTLVSTGLTAPNDYCFLPDGRILIANRPGNITVYAGGPTANVGMVPNVSLGSEFGLLSIAADPSFPNNGYIYVWWSSTLDNYMHMDRFTCNGDRANASSTNLVLDLSSQRPILNLVPNNAFNHNGGSTRFGPDGKLYQTIGDDAGTCAAQSLVNQQGVLMRLDVSNLPAGGSTTAPTYAQLDPGDNPRSNIATDVSRLLLGYGLRNPFRMTIDPVTGNLYIGDVGQSTREEYDEYVYVQGALQLANFGWPWREGTLPYTTCTGTQPPGLTGPMIDIDASQGWHAVMGGPRYRNRSGQFDFGPAYEGVAFYADYFAGQLRRLSFNGTSWAPAPAVAGQPTANDWANNLVGLVGYDVGPDGAIYFVQHPMTYATAGGYLKRIRPLGPVNSVVSVSGTGQVGPASEAFPQPIVARVLDHSNAPLPGGLVNFTVSGAATLSTTNPVVADGNGYAQTIATATSAGGSITVSATTPNGDPTAATWSLFARHLAIIETANITLITISNTTAATPAQIPFMILCSVPGQPPLQTYFGPLCTDPTGPLTFAVEDSIGVFGFTSLSGTGAIGTPSVTKIYNIHSSALTGISLNFQGIGVDPIGGLFRTDCALHTF